MARTSYANNWIKIVTIHGHYRFPINAQKHSILAIIASKEGPVVEFAKVVATNAKVISLLALWAKAAQRN